MTDSSQNLTFKIRATDESGVARVSASCNGQVVFSVKPFADTDKSPIFVIGPGWVPYKSLTGTITDFTIEFEVALRQGFKPGLFGCFVSTEDTLAQSKNYESQGFITVVRDGIGYLPLRLSKFKAGSNVLSSASKAAVLKYVSNRGVGKTLTVTSVPAKSTKSAAAKLLAQKRAAAVVSLVKSVADNSELNIKVIIGKRGPESTSILLSR